MIIRLVSRITKKMQSCTFHWFPFNNYQDSCANCGISEEDLQGFHSWRGDKLSIMDAQTGGGYIVES